jgi:hypothetical protein
MRQQLTSKYKQWDSYQNKRLNTTNERQENTFHRVLHTVNADYAYRRGKQRHHQRYSCKCQRKK